MLSVVCHCRCDTRLGKRARGSGKSSGGANCWATASRCGSNVLSDSTRGRVSIAGRASISVSCTEGAFGNIALLSSGTGSGTAARCRSCDSAIPTSARSSRDSVRALCEVEQDAVKQETRALLGDETAYECAEYTPWQ